MSIRKETLVGGHKLTLEVGKVAKQADGAVLVRQGDTVVLVTATSDRRERVGLDFLPLTVDYRENTYAAGKIPGGFFKREGRPNEKETLTSRMIDRPIRPLFPKGWRCETQVVALVLSADLENDPDILAVTGASAALTISDIPFDTPVAAVRVGLGEDGFIINPTTTQLVKSRLDLVVVGSDKEVVMVEAAANEVSEQEMVDAILLGQAEIVKLVALQEELRREVGVAKRPAPAVEIPGDLQTEVEEKVSGPLWDAMKVRNKIQSYRRIAEMEKSLLEGYPEEPPETRSFVKAAFHEVHKKLARTEIIEKGKRFDDRGFEDVRPITCEVGFLPRTHGSALFTRGETQALVTTTLGTSEDAQTLDWLEGESERRFMLHYNFPPFSVGEVKFLRGPGRREIGHGALAERAIRPMMPGDEEFPYTIRLVSDILESNGSSSMASICGGSLCLMDAGVPLKAAVGGIAMGLVKEGDRYVILSDIAGSEDHYGDMDFKVAGTRKGITALQMDIKVQGLSREILEKALAQAHRGRMHILDVMDAALASPRPDISSLCPQDLQHPGPEGQDPGSHRPGRQDDPFHHRADRLQDRHRRRRQGGHRLRGRGLGPEGHRDHQGNHRRGRDREDLPRKSGENRRLRSLCRDPARNRGASSHLGNRGAPGEGGHRRDPGG